MKSIQRYGTPLVGYEGVCEVELKREDSLFLHKGYFEAAHLFSGRLVVGVMATESQRPKSFTLASDYDLSFTGSATEGWELETVGPTFSPSLSWILPSTGEREFVAYRMEAHRNGASTDGYTNARFLLSNFLWHDSSDNNPEPIQLEARGYQVVVKADG